MASNNVSDAISALNIADSTGTEVTSMVQRQRELAIQARNDTLTDEQREQLDVEYQQLTTEINRITEATQFNTQPVANGEGLGSGEAQVQAGANEGDQVTMPQIDMSGVTLQIEGTSIATRGGAAQALGRLDGALNTLNRERSQIGAMTNRLQSTQNNLAVSAINTQAAESVIRDQDMAQGIASFVRNRMLQEGGIRSFARFNEISANHLFALLQ
jgi:flagellin